LIVFPEPLSSRHGDFTLGPFTLDDFADEVTVLLGDNGAGKSTLFEQMRSHLSREDVRFGFLPQTFTLPPFVRLIDACDFVAQQRVGAGRDERRRQVTEALEATDLADEAEKNCRELSGGMIRRAGICLTLIGDPQFVMLDEPTVGLDITQRAGVLEVISRLSEKIPVVMSTHLPSDLGAVGSRVVMLDHGQLLFDGEREAFLTGDDGQEASWEDAYKAHLSVGVGA
jgi:ABC-2 type transport system ATP-binding protein